MRTITQNVSLRAADVDAFTVIDTDVAGPFPLNLPLDGALSAVSVFDGSSFIDLSDANGVLIGFTTGVTGSAANVTITGRNQFGNPITEVVTLPGASSSVSSTEIFSYIESMSIDGVYTNLSVGILAADSQYSPWTPLDVHAGDFNVTVSVELVSGTVNFTLEHTVQGDLMINGPEPDNSFDDTGMAAQSTSSQLQVSQPVTASRIRINSGSAAVLRIKYLQSGSGNK